MRRFLCFFLTFLLLSPLYTVCDLLGRPLSAAVRALGGAGAHLLPLSDEDAQQQAEELFLENRE